MEKPNDCEDIDFEHYWVYSTDTEVGNDKWERAKRTCKNCGHVDIQKWIRVDKPIP